VDLFGVNFEYQRTDFYENFHKPKVSDVFSAERREDFETKVIIVLFNFFQTIPLKCLYIIDMKKNLQSYLSFMLEFV